MRAMVFRADSKGEIIKHTLKVVYELDGKKFDCQVDYDGPLTQNHLDKLAWKAGQEFKAEKKGYAKFS